MPDRRAPAEPFELAQLEPRTLLAADPITPDHPMWAIPRGSAVVDGVVNEAEWGHALEIHRTQATRINSALWVRMMWADAGIYLSVEAQDQNIWADGTGGGAGNRWEIETDDSVTFFFDPDRSREAFLQPDDYAFGVNLGGFGSPTNDPSEAVRRFKYVVGDGMGGAPNAGYFNEGRTSDDWEDLFLPPGAAYASSIDGTVNDPTDVDTGWSIEIFLPWWTIGLSGAPSHGQTIGMNFDIIFDQDGGIRNLADNRNGNQRFDLPHFVDDHVLGAHSSYRAAGGGVNGPANYAEAMFVDARATGVAPAPITDLSVAHPSPFGAQLFFTAPAGTGAGLGHVSAYEIRYSASPIAGEADWAAATPFANTYVPRLSGLSERLRIAELEPGTTHHIAIRAVDAVGNRGPISGSVSVTTLAPDGTRGRIIPAAVGSGLMHEDGTPFVPVGDHLGLPWAYTRTLFPGDIWDRNFSIYQNFYERTPAEGTAEQHFQNLAAHGVNTMRLYVEFQNSHNTNTPSPPFGTYWLESNRGQFNPDMRDFIHNVMELSAQYGIHLIISPFNPYDYDDVFGIEGPWATNFGGPLASIDDFFQSDETLAMSILRMRTVADWVRQSPHAHTVLGYETISEWDARWTLNSEGEGTPGRENEFRRRSIWMIQLAEAIRQHDPDRLVLNSTVQRDPRGPIARVLFYDRTWDALTNHFYTQGNDEPINNPAQDRRILAAQEMAHFTEYFATHRIDNRPILNGEWGNTRADWPNQLPEWSGAFTQQEDEAIYRTVIWSGFATGQIGTGLRIATEELRGTGFLLTDAMMDYQLAFSRFALDTGLAIDWAHADLDALAGRLFASAPGQTLHAWGVSDGAQGMAYVIRDGNVASGLASDASATLTGLALDRVFDIEFWDPSTGVVVSTIRGVYSGDGRLTLALPTFAHDLAIKFRARERVTDAEQVASIAAFGSVWTFTLGIDRQPVATITDGVTGATRTLDVSALSGFSAEVVDMTAFLTPFNVLSLAVTDAESHLWLLTRNPATGGWTRVDLTLAIGAPGLAGDLTTYQPSWGSIHVAGLDARGHAVNYWWSPGSGAWQHTNLKELIGGDLLNSGLTGFVAPWDGLNLAGLNDRGEVVVYWWAPGLSTWQQLNMTTVFDGPTFTGKLDAYVTAWGAMNIAGRDDRGSLVTYWWAPGLDGDPNQWRIADLSSVSGAGPVRLGATTALSADGGINAFAIDDDGALILQRWTPAQRGWASTNVSARTDAPRVTTPFAAGAAGDFIVLAAQDADSPDRTLLFRYQISTDLWTLDPIGLAA